MREELYSPFNKALVARMRDARVAARITQAEMGTMTSRTQAYISKFERGQLRLDVADFILFCKALGLDPVTLIAELSALPSAPELHRGAPDRLTRLADDTAHQVAAAVSTMFAGSLSDQTQALIEEAVSEAITRAVEDGLAEDQSD